MRRSPSTSTPRMDGRRTTCSSSEEGEAQGGAGASAAGLGLGRGWQTLHQLGTRLAQGSVPTLPAHHDRRLCRRQAQLRGEEGKEGGQPVGDRVAQQRRVHRYGLQIARQWGRAQQRGRLGGRHAACQTQSNMCTRPWLQACNAAAPPLALAVCSLLSPAVSCRNATTGVMSASTSSLRACGLVGCLRLFRANRLFGFMATSCGRRDGRDGRAVG